MHLFDQKIILNSLRTSAKSKFNLIWIGIMTPIIIAIFFAFALVNQGRADYLGYNILAISLSVLLTVLVWEIVNLNFSFSSSRELGIMNLEIRKGRTSKEIFFSRLLVNKILSLGYILLMMAIFLIIYASFNARDLTIFWIFLTFIPTDLFLTAAFLFLMAFGRYKLAISLTSILLTLIAFTPFLQMLGQVIVTKEPIRQDLIAKIYSANRVLNLAHQEEVNATPSFTYQLLNEAKLFNEMIDTSQLRNRSSVNSKIEGLVFDGLILDSAVLLNRMWNQLPEFSSIEKTEPLQIKSSIQGTLLFQVNKEFAVDRGSLVADYQNSVYSDHQVTNTHYQSMIQKLKALIEKINRQFPSEAFNQIVLDYAQGMLFNPDSGRTVYVDVVNEDGGYGYFYVTYQNYLERIRQNLHLYGLELEEYQKMAFSLFSVAPELRLWNEIVVQLMVNALSLELKEMQEWFVSQTAVQRVAFFPWSTQYEAWVLANPNLGFYDYYRLDTGKFFSFSWYWIWNDSQYYNDFSSDEDKRNVTFKSLKKIKATKFSSAGTNFKAFSILGYELTIAGIALVLTGIAFWIFLKKIKK